MTDESTALRTMFHRSRTSKLIEQIIRCLLGIQDSIEIIDRVCSGSALSEQCTFFGHLEGNDGSRA